MKKMLFLLMILVLTIALVACADDAEQTADVPAGTRELVMYTTVVNEQAAPHFFAEFEEMHDASITHIFITAEEYMRTLMIAYNGGQQIDVLGINGQDTRVLSNRGVIIPLSEFRYWDRVSPAAKETASIGGIPFMVPWDSVGGMSMYYNRALFEEHGVAVPTNMAELRAAKEVFDAHGISMFAHCGATIYMWPSWYFMLFNSTSGGQAVERQEAILRGQAAFTDEDTLQAFRILHELGDGFFQPGVNATDREGAEQIFIQGLSAMTFAGSWQLNAFRLGGMEDIGMTSAMSFVDGDIFRTTGSAGGNGWAICSRTADEALGFAFLEWVSQDEKMIEANYADYLETPQTGALIFSNLNARAPAHIEMDPLMEYYRDNMLPHMKIWLDWLWPPEVTTAFQEQIQMVVGQQTTPEEAVAVIQRVLDEAIADGFDFDAVPD